MPSSTSSSERQQRFPAGLFIGLGLFVATEQLLWSNPRVLALAARYTPAGPDGDPLLNAAAVAQVRARPGSRPGVLLLGSSQVREGLDCGAFEVRLGTGCDNLAISAGSPLDMLQIASQLEPSGVQLRVVGLFPKLLHLPPKEGFVGLSTFRCLPAAGLRRILTQHAGLLAYGLLQSISPTLRFKDALSAARGVIRADPLAAWQLRLPPAPHRLLEHQPPRPQRYFDHHVARLDSDAPRPGDWTAAQEAALDRLLDPSLGPAVLVDFPTRPGYETTQHPETLDHYRRSLARWRERGASVISADELGPLAPADFVDFTHLTDAGRAKVSERLARRVAAVDWKP